MCTHEHENCVIEDFEIEPHKQHFLMIPHPALPHVTPMVHLAEKLAQQGGVACTVLTFDYLLEKVDKRHLSDHIHLVSLPKDLTGFSTDHRFPPIVHSEELAFVANPYIEKLLQKESAHNYGRPLFTGLISDFLLGWTAEAAAKLNVPRFILSPISAFSLLLLLYSPVSDAEGERTLSWPNIFAEGISSRFFYVHYGFIEYTRRSWSLSSTETMLVNSFYDMESHAFDALRSLGKKVLPVGPLESAVQASKASIENDQDVDRECILWLNRQPADSVVYVNFGTTGFNCFTLEMVHELALGVEASQARFLWVLRPPPTLTPDKLDQLLPSGFEERVKDRGLILRGWAPQLEILEHPSTATFVMHGGWNSTQETIARGIPFIVWATFADQPSNAKYAAEVAKVGLRIPEEKKVDRHDIEKAIRMMLSSEEGKLIKKRAQHLKVAAARAIKPEPGGSSFQSVLKFVTDAKLALKQ